jgi:serine/threonine protein kinase
MLTPGTILQDRIEIRGMLGKGGYGAVYEAYHQHLKKTVAIKEMLHRGDQSFVEHFEREAQLLASLSHPVLPVVTDFFPDKEGFYFVMEYVPGEDLQSYVDRQPNSLLRQEQALQIIAPILDALDYLHRKKPPIIHRDIKPANIRITPEDKVVLVDFGIAKFYDPSTKTSTLARAVTAGFSPLEQYRGGGATSPSSDLYAVGATLYYMVTGVVPPDAVQRAQLDSLSPMHALNADITPWFEAIVSKLMAIHPERRFQDIPSLRHSLNNHHTETGAKPMLDKNRVGVSIGEISAEITNRERAVPGSLLDTLALQALQATRERLLQINKILSQNTYDLVFIGRIGTGKTTAICHLFDLTYEDTKPVKSSARSKERKEKFVRPLLSTGSGNTTISEVIIRPSSVTYVEIESYDIQTVEQLISDFALSSWIAAYPKSSVAEGSPQPLTSEITRAIRNMTGLKIRSLKEKDADEDTSRSIDGAVEFAQQFAVEQFEAFQREVIARAKLESRTSTRIGYPGADDQIEKNWLRDTFESVNLVSLPDISIPRVIRVGLSEQILSPTNFPRLGAVIDTRGLSSIPTRPDLESYIHERNDAICIFTDLFPQAPTTVFDLMQRYITPEAHDVASKSMVMVLPKKGEPEEVKGPDGTVQDRDEGLALRRNDIEKTFQGASMAIVPDNIIFYDALQFYRTDHRRDPDYELYDIEAERQRILRALVDLLDRREQLLWGEYLSLEKRYQEITTGRGLDPDEEQLISIIHEELKGYKNQSFSVADFPERYIRFWRPSHASTLRAVNNRRGRYEPRDIDIYFAGAPTAKDLLQSMSRALKEKIVGTISRLDSEVTEQSDLRALAQAFISRIDTYYEEFIDQVGSQIRAHLAEDTFESHEFWYGVQNRWGAGPGFSADVISMYRSQLDDDDITEVLAEFATSAWRSHFIDRILAFFGS